MDYGHEQTDKMLTQLEKRLRTEYSKASRGISRSMREYLKDFEREDSEMLKLLNENKITEKKYLAWRNTQMATGTRWEQMKSTITEDLQNTSNIAADMIRDHSYDAYALNHNYGTFEIEQGAKADTSYTLYDRATVERLVAQNPKLLHAPGKRTQKLIEEGKAKLWNNRQVQSVMTQAVLQGMPVPKIANYLAKTVGERNLHVATRSARTLITGAENAGRVDSYERARGMGINVKARWMATLDSRTRHSHRQLDGAVADDDGLFPNGLRFPGDPDGPFSEICNCRCTLVGWIKGINDDLFDPSNRITGKGFTDYEDWKQAHEKGRDGRMTIRNIGPEPKRPKREYDENGYLTDEFYKKRDAYIERKTRWEEQRDAWVQQELPARSMTLNEFGGWCKTHDVVIYNDISAVDGRMLAAYASRMDKLFSDFPEVKWYRREIDFSKWDLVPNEINLHYQVLFEDTTDFIAEANHGMTFGHVFTNAENALLDKFNLTQQGYLTYGDGTINQIFDHEFGHNVMDWMMYRNGGMSTHQRVEFENDILRSLSGKTGGSEYSTANVDELFAEGFSAWYGGEDTEFAKATKDLLKRYKVI